MSNLTDLAFPLIEDCPSGPSISCGFTKHEYAAILIAAQLCQTDTQLDDIPGMAYNLAKSVLSKFD